jgi:glycosyltransferase involved in cell wall biosynthesis
LRIAIATQTYDPGVNGQGAFTRRLAEGLAHNGHQVIVITPSERGSGYDDARGGVLIRAVGALSLAPLYRSVYVTLRPSAEIDSVLDRFRPEIVHIQDHYPLCRSAVCIARSRKLPVIGTNHFLPDNMAPRLRLTAFCGPFVDRVLWRTVLDVMNQARIVTTPTQTAAEILRQQPIRVPVEPISNGVDLGRFGLDHPRTRGKMRRRYGLDPKSTIFFYLGRLDPEKRVDVLIYAFKYLRRQDLQLGIAGRGRGARALQALARRLGLEREVVFTGFVPAEDLPPLLSSIDVFAMPSEAELQSIATLEAMASGRPILAADARALPELVQDGVNGYLFRAGDPADAARRIEQFAARRDDWARMGSASRQIASNHNLDHTIQSYVRLYRRIIKSYPRVIQKK